MTSHPSISLGEILTLNEMLQASDNPSLLTLSNDTRYKIAEARALVDTMNSNERPVYGVSTGFGHLENKWIPPEEQSQLQINLIRSHAIGTGEQIPKIITQRAMILLANSLSKGHSGVKIETVERILFYIQNDIIPVCYTLGSLGASGDLAPLAHIALTLMGEGKLQVKESIRSTSEILDEFHLLPLVLKAKEGLALINGTHFITAYGITVRQDAIRLIQLSIIASGLSIEALRATDTPFDDRIADLRMHPGHKIIAGLMSEILNGSQIMAEHQDPLIDHKTQDSYAIRCIPQVMGAIWDAFAYLERVLSIEINAVTDNPLVFPESSQILSGGNFHAEPLGLPLETINMALIELANITEARIARLVSPFTPELPAFLASNPGLESGYMIAHYTVAAIVNKLRSMAYPNITDNIPVSGNQEDHVSMAMNTAVRANTILLLVEECIVFELMMSVRGLNLVEHLESSPILNEIIMLINSKIKFHSEDHVIHETLMEYKKIVETGELNIILERFLDFPKSFN